MKQRPIKKKLESMVQAFQDDVNEHVACQKLLEDDDLGEFEYWVGLKVLKSYENVFFSLPLTSRGQCYKTFYGRDLRIFVIS